MTDWLTEWLIWLNGRLTDVVTYWLIDLITDWIDWMIDWLFDNHFYRLTAWLTNQIIYWTDNLLTDLTEMAAWLNNQLKDGCVGLLTRDWLTDWSSSICSFASLLFSKCLIQQILASMNKQEYHVTSICQTFQSKPPWIHSVWSYYWKSVGGLLNVQDCLTQAGKPCVAMCVNECFILTSAGA